MAGRWPKAEHLLARQRHPDRALQLPRRQDGQEHLVLRAQPRAERPADERRDDAQLVRGEAEHVAEVVLDVLHPLRLVVDGELAVLVPDHGRREQLHRVVMLDRHVVLRFDSHGGAGEGASRRRRAASAPAGCRSRVCGS